jgi:hypothetical protein
VSRILVTGSTDGLGTTLPGIHDIPLQEELVDLCDAQLTGSRL